ncbi:MAG TPA: hypothetical protein VJ765_04355, partial [Chitinophagaceae bacterium]|nr:hypothetical protein [Chitinophagaceae bacterium]
MKKKAKIKTKTRANQPEVKTENLKPPKEKAFTFWLVTILAVTGLSFFPMLNNGFTNWDDDV